MIESIDYSQYLLSKSKVNDLNYFLRLWKEQLEELNSKYNFYAKYQHDILMLDRLNKTKDEMWTIALDCIPFIEWLEYDIKETERLLYMNRLAVVKLRDSNLPFKGIKLSEHELIQTSLF